MKFIKYIIVFLIVLLLSLFFMRSTKRELAQTIQEFKAGIEANDVTIKGWDNKISRWDMFAKKALMSNQDYMELAVVNNGHIYNNSGFAVVTGIKTTKAKIAFPHQRIELAAVTATLQEGGEYEICADNLLYTNNQAYLQGKVLLRGNQENITAKSALISIVPVVAGSFTQATLNYKQYLIQTEMLQFSNNIFVFPRKVVISDADIHIMADIATYNKKLDMLTLEGAINIKTKANITAQAEKAQLKGETLNLWGNVYMEQNGRSLKCDKTSINIKSNNMEAQGKITTKINI